ncbi:MAG: tyramine oxidase, partial [Chloroflexota bacterium]|nr:tyramine oxidase [Chloroflexota bacterium]
LDRRDGRVFEAVVDVTNERLMSWEEIEDVQPQILSSEFQTAARLVRSDPTWRQAIRKRGIRDLGDVRLGGMTPGYFGRPEEEGARLVAIVAYQRDTITRYARPIEGVVVYVDLNEQEVVDVVDTGVVPIPPPATDSSSEAERFSEEELLASEENDAEELSFRVENGEVRWQKWRFRFGMHPRTGLELYTVGWEEGDNIRSILYRGSLSEMLVPYAEPSPAWFFRSPLDVGEYEIGREAVRLQPGIECPEHARFFDAVYADEFGTPQDYPNAVCLFEHGGELTRGIDGLRQTRELVLRYVASVGNYDYGFDWIFHEDGTLGMEVAAMGIVLPKGVESDHMSDESAASDTRFGELVAENVVAPHHQHFFSWRLDLDVDGLENNAVEVNVERLPPDEESNPWLNAFGPEQTTFRTEQEAQRHANRASSREWKVVNPSVENELGHPVGYTLEPGEVAAPYAHPESWIRRRAAFADYHLWVTPYRADELYAAGEYPTQSQGDTGLSQWTEADRSIYNTDIVLWYTMGMTHITRTEDWPVMPTDHLSFKLLPTHFFDRKPTLD